MKHALIIVGAVAYMLVAIGAFLGFDEDQRRDCLGCSLFFAALWPVVLVFRFGLWVTEPH